MAFVGGIDRVVEGFGCLVAEREQADVADHDEVGSVDLGGAGGGTVGIGSADGDGRNDLGHAGAPVSGIRRSSCAPALEALRLQQPSLIV